MASLADSHGPGFQVTFDDQDLAPVVAVEPVEDKRELSTLIHWGPPRNANSPSGGSYLVSDHG